jgi:hypothetical protein
MNKVMLTKTEAEALESALEVNGGDKANVVHWHAQDLWDSKRAPLNNLDLDTICRALYVGFEIEASPEDNAREFYNEVVVHGYGYIIRHTLNLLNIKISGINC